MTLLYLIQKEFLQILRNILLPIVFIILPLALINGVPRIATQEVKGLRFCVIDNDHSTTARRLIQQMDASSLIDLAAVCRHYNEAMDEIDAGRADVIVEIPHGFEKDLAGRGKPAISLAANATNGTKGSMAQAYLLQIIADAQLTDTQGRPQPPLAKHTPATAASPIAVQMRFNPRLDYKLYMVPALLGMFLILIVGFLPALNIVGEKEKGTIEQINVTPIRKWEFIVSKVVPYVIIDLLMFVEGLLVARGIFGFESAGSLGSLFIFVLVFCMLVSSFGLIVSNYCQTLSQAALTMFFFLVIFLLMSGLLTPLSSMPDWAQRLTLVNPLRYFVEAMRAIYIKGATLADVHSQFIILCAYASVTWAWAILSYRKNR